MQQVMGSQWTEQHGKVLLAVAFDPKLIGERIAAAREAKRWTQLDFALEAGVSPSTIQRWEAGHLPPVRRLMRVAELLEVEPEELIEPQPAEPPSEMLTRLESLQADAEEGRLRVVQALEALARGIERIEARLAERDERDRAIR